MRAVAYIIAQVGGAATGTAFVWTVRSVKGAANQVNVEGGYAAAFMAEWLLTFLLMFVVLCATDAARYRSIAHLPVLAPFAIGVTVLIAHLAAIPLDGCSINPARSLATMLLSGVAPFQQWIFVSFFFFFFRGLGPFFSRRARSHHPAPIRLQWVAPIAGAICATYVYELGFRPDYDPFISLESGGASGAAATAGGKASAYPTA